MTEKEDTMEAFYDKRIPHLLGKKLSTSHYCVRHPYRAAAEGGTVPQFVGISVIVEGARAYHTSLASVVVLMWLSLMNLSLIICLRRGIGI